MEHYDLVVIGAGPAGQSAAEVATYLGHRAVLVENDHPGGVVTTTGGAPTKTLREAALYLTGFGQEEVYGVRDATPLAEALPIIQARVVQVRNLLQGVARRQLLDRGVDYVQGTARLRPAGGGDGRERGHGRLVEVTTPDGSRVELVGRRVLVATGSRPARLPGIPVDDPDVYDTDRIYTLRSVPREIVIIGGGPVGVEYATVFTALGIPVRMVSQSDRLLPTMDGEMTGLLADVFRRRGIEVTLDAGVAEVARRDGRLTVALSTGAELTTDLVLVAAGRTPNTETLGAAEAGVELDGRGRVVVDRGYRTSAPGVYAAGDVIGPTLASTASQQGRAAACHALGLVLAAAIDTTAGSAVYGVPEVAGVGLTEEEVRASGVEYVVGRCDLALIARGAISGHGGQLKLIVRAGDRRLVGVHCIGDIASELVGLGHLAINLGATVEVLLVLGLNTPTYSYAYHDAAIDALTRLSAWMNQPAGPVPVPVSQPSVPVSRPTVPVSASAGVRA